MNPLSRLAVAAAVIGLSAAPLFATAGTQTATLTINGSVVANCQAFTPASSSITFTAYDPFTYATANDDDNTGASFSTNCTKGTVINYSVSGGSNYTHAASLGNRALSDGSSHYLDYQLFQESSHTNAWAFNTGTGVGSNVSGGTSSSNSATQTVNVFGRIPSGQDPTTGSYTDSVTVTVSF